MKLISFLAAAAVLGLGVFALALSFNIPTLGLYAGVASVLVVLGAVRDYSPRCAYCVSADPTLIPFLTGIIHQPTRLAA